MLERRNRVTRAGLAFDCPDQSFYGESVPSYVPIVAERTRSAPAVISLRLLQGPFRVTARLGACPWWGLRDICWHTNKVLPGHPLILRPQLLPGIASPELGRIHVSAAVEGSVGTMNCGSTRGTARLASWLHSRGCQVTSPPADVRFPGFRAGRQTQALPTRHHHRFSRLDWRCPAIPARRAEHFVPPQEGPAEPARPQRYGPPPSQTVTTG
ncbi:hypothetical protein ACFDR8_000957 [Arthrobacter sp. MP_2.3]